MPEDGRHAWASSGAEDLGGGVYRIPLPLPLAALRAVNVYAILGEDGLDLIDAGMAVTGARDELAKSLKAMGTSLADVGNFFITHMHRDHYTLAAELRRAGRGRVSLGTGEQANLVAARELARTREDGAAAAAFLADLNRMGALRLAGQLGGSGVRPPAAEEWDDPDRWLADGTELDVRGRTLRAIRTPGHTRGHLVFHDAANRVLFAGDHILPHITPTIGFEPARNPLALRDYLGSLRLILTLPDARLLPAHGPVRDSAHDRVRQLLDHHEERLAEVMEAIGTGRSTGYETAGAVRWTRHRRRFTELDLTSQLLATGETTAHLEVLVLRGQLTKHTDPSGTEHYQAAVAPAPG